MGGPITENLPQILIDTLENGPFGRDYIWQLDRKLAAVTRN
jgi:hypothetical protein